MRSTLLTLCLSLLFLSTVTAQSANREKLLRNLLDLPAPAPSQPDASDKPETAEGPGGLYRSKNIPPDDAPLEDLLEYWKGQRYSPATISYRRRMSARTAERILDHLKDNPTLIPTYLGGFPTDDRTAGQLRDIYRSSKEGDSAEVFLNLQQWLTNNTTDGVAELSRVVRKIRDNNDYVSNQFQVALQSLARVDWDAARPHVERLEFDGSNPHSQILAYWTRYTHALAENNSSDIETYRRKLQQVVEDRSARYSQRDLAMDALVDGGNWDGRDAWYMSLFSDETLLEIQDNGYTGMTTLMNASASPEEWMDRFLSLVKSDNKAARSAGARNLMSIYNGQPQILEALLPWVADANWAKESQFSERRRLIEALGDIDVPGSLPALMSVVSNESDNGWSTAVAAIAKRKDPRTAPALRSLLTKTSGDLRRMVIGALVACGAMSADEQMTDVEVYAAMSLTEEGRVALELDAHSEYSVDYDDDEASKAPKKFSLPIEVVIGKALADVDEPDESLAALAIERAKAVQIKNPELSAKLTEIINGWSGRPIYLERVRRIRTGETDLDNIIGLLAERATVREKIPNELNALRSASGVARGVGACLTERDDEFLSIISDDDVESQVAMLGCARLLRTNLPVKDIARMFDSPNAMLKEAAERYLESEGSLDARRIVLARHPGEARLLGSHSAFMPDPKKVESSSYLDELFKTVNAKSYIASLPNLRAFERKLQTEIKEDKNLIAIFAQLPEGKSQQQVVRLYKDRSTYTYYDDPARSWSRNLTDKEYANFYSSIVSNKIDSLSPTLHGCNDVDARCPGAEFVLLGRDGGRRVFFSGYPYGHEIHAVDEQFETLKTTGELKLSYRLADKIKGLEVIVADSNFPVYAVWKRGTDLRFLVSDLALAQSVQKDLAEKLKSESIPETDDEDEAVTRARQTKIFELQQQLREEAMGKELSWRTLEKSTVGPIVQQPDGMNLLRRLAEIPPNYRSSFFRSAGPIDGADGVYASRYENGLFRDQAGEPVKIREGRYERAVASPDKTWAAATKFTDDDKKVIARLNLRTGREFLLSLPNANGLYPIAYVPSLAKVLLYRGPDAPREEFGFGMNDDDVADDEDPAETKDSSSTASPGKAEYYLLDLPTGAVRPVKGEFRPIEERPYRPLQASSTPGSAWAAVYDRESNSTQVGLYQERTFTFVPITTLPEIRLRSTDIWVSEDDKKVYFVYQNHLLAAPLGTL
ncbi:MAG: hypothetical protein DMF63_05990 [Acidobacteria bacterium]|nr:MAG: hypothetical protein DMF63_05990 [Acidobacteriota bacterium]